MNPWELASLWLTWRATELDQHAADAAGLPPRGGERQEAIAAYIEALRVSAAALRLEAGALAARGRR